MKLLLWILLLAIALFALHHLALWAERRGWIYYIHRKASPGSVGSAFMEVQSLLEPGTRHVVESRLNDVADEDESGDPPPEREGNRDVD
jgi:hypothetical protein